MRSGLLGLLLLAAAASLPAQDYGDSSPGGSGYQRVHRETVVGPDGRLYIRRGDRLILADDPQLHRPWVDLPPGSRVVGRIADSVMIETADGKRLTCTPVGGQTICH